MRLIDADNVRFSKGIKMNGILYVPFGEISKAPTVDAVEVVHGKWEQIDVQPYFRKHYPNSDVCCSKCHTRGNTKYHYCPYCGAKMDEVSE